MEALTLMFQSKLFWITAFFAAIYAYFKFVIYGFWKRKGIPYDDPIIPFGSALPLMTGKTSLGNLIRYKYNESKKYPVYGIYMFYKPILLINNLDLAQSILVKDFNKFHDRGLYFNEELDPLSVHLFFMPGERWKKLRTKLTPTFTSGKLKQMLSLFLEIGDDLVRACDKMLKEDSIVEFKDLAGRYTTDTISSMAFGFNCKSLENGTSEFQRKGKLFFDQSPLISIVGAFAQGVLDFFRIPFTPKESIKFFTETFTEVLKERRRSKVVRKDFMELLMQLLDKGALDGGEPNSKSDDNNENDPNEHKITLKEAIGQAYIFYLAGYETTSSTIAYCLYELALHPEIQEKLQEEIDEFVKKDEGITYDVLFNDMKYLHMVFLETLRKHPSIPFLNRVCNEDYNIPNTNIRIEKGTGIIVCMNATQRDPDLFPDPDRFDPLRFSKENIASRHPYSHMPFGEGPRSCIGTRFGSLQTKIALVSLLSNYKFSVCEKTPIPLKYSVRSLTQTPEGGLYLKMEKRNKT